MGQGKNSERFSGTWNRARRLESVCDSAYRS